MRVWHSAIYPFCATFSLVKNAADAKLVKTSLSTGVFKGHCQGYIALCHTREGCREKQPTQGNGIVRGELVCLHWKDGI